MSVRTALNTPTTKMLRIVMTTRRRMPESYGALTLRESTVTFSDWRIDNWLTLFTRRH